MGSLQLLHRCFALTFIFFFSLFNGKFNVCMRMNIFNGNLLIEHEVTNCSIGPSFVAKHLYFVSDAGAPVLAIL